MLVIGIRVCGFWFFFGSDRLFLATVATQWSLSACALSLHLSALSLYLLYLPSTVTSTPLPFLVPTIYLYVYALLCAYSLMSLLVLRNTSTHLFVCTCLGWFLCSYARLYSHVFARAYTLSYHYLVLLLILLLCHPTTYINIYYMCISLTI